MAQETRIPAGSLPVAANANDMVNAAPPIAATGKPESKGKPEVRVVDVRQDAPLADQIRKTENELTTIDSQLFTARAKLDADKKSWNHNHKILAVLTYPIERYMKWVDGAHSVLGKIARIFAPVVAAMALIALVPVLTLVIVPVGLVSGVSVIVMPTENNPLPGDRSKVEYLTMKRDECASTLAELRRKQKTQAQLAPQRSNPTSTLVTLAPQAQPPKWTK